MRSKTKNPASKRGGLLLAALLFPSFSFAQAQTVNATIDASKTGAPISKYIYGQFLEHIGSIVNSGIWAEMLDDRKFYNPVAPKPPDEPESPAGRRRMAPRHAGSSVWHSWEVGPLAGLCGTASVQSADDRPVAGLQRLLDRRIARRLAGA